MQKEEKWHIIFFFPTIFGLRSLVIQKTVQTESATAMVASVQMWVQVFAFVVLDVAVECRWRFRLFFSVCNRFVSIAVYPECVTCVFVFVRACLRFCVCPFLCTFLCVRILSIYCMRMYLCCMLAFLCVCISLYVSVCTHTKCILYANASVLYVGLVSCSSASV